MKVELVSDFSDRHGVGEILLVGQNQQNSIPQFILTQHLGEFLSSTSVTSIDTLSVIRVDHEDNCVSVLVVVSPQGTNLILTSDIPVKSKE
jgi:hypothetical protein